MATRRDQLQSYQYLIQRVLAAFVMRETDPAQSPLRRGIGAIFGGVMITVLVGAGFGVYGILTKVGSDSWKSDGSVVIEKETGASFVYFDGRLHPALNYSSALLAAGSPTRSVSRVAGKALASVPRGLTVGIAGAPDSLPGAGQLLGLPWTVCAAPGRDDTGQPVSTVTLVVSRGPDGAEPLGERGVLVGDTGSGEAHLVWHGHRHRLREPENVVPALFGELVTAVPAGTAWLNALPVGAEIGPIVVADRGRPSGALPDRAIGDVLVAETGSGPQHYLVFDDGLAPITELQKDILVGQQSGQPATVSVAEATSAPTSGELGQPDGSIPPPPAPPPLATPTGGDLLCAVTGDAAAPPQVWAGGAVAGLDQAAPTGSADPAGVSHTDRVLVPAGHLAVVRVVGAPGGTGAYYLVTDLGIRHAVPSPEVLQLLGYQPDQAVDVPASLVTRIPAGATLDPAAAIRPAGITTASR